MQRFLSQDPYFANGYKAMNIILEEDLPQNRGALWLGDYTAAQDKMTLKAKGIKSVLTVAQGLSISYPKGCDIAHKTYYIQDVESAIISKIWNDTYQRIDEGLSKGGVLVHCAAGVSRSASTVIAYIMRKQEKGFLETINFVRSKRPVICPNFGFQRQLKAFERELRQDQPQFQTQQQQPSQYQQKDKTNNYIKQLQQAQINDYITPSKQQPFTPIQFTPVKLTSPTAQRSSLSSVRQKQNNQSPLTKQTLQNSKQNEFGQSKPFTSGLGNLQEKQQRQLDKEIILQQISNLNKSPFLGQNASKLQQKIQKPSNLSLAYK